MERVTSNLFVCADMLLMEKKSWEIFANSLSVREHMFHSDILTVKMVIKFRAIRDIFYLQKQNTINQNLEICQQLIKSTSNIA